MAESSVVKTSRDGSIVFKDGTGTPLDFTLTFDTGDLAISGMSAVNDLNGKYYNHTEIQSRGELVSRRKTDRVFPTVGGSMYMRSFHHATEERFNDFIQGKGAFASRVSTTGASADVFCCDIVFTVESTNHGDSADEVVTLNDVIIDAWDFAEAMEGNTFTFGGMVTGEIAFT